MIRHCLRPLRRGFLFAAFLLALAPQVRSASVPTPESVLGFRIGEDRILADWTQIMDFFEKLGAASPRVRVENVGTTTEGRPFLVVTITSEANMRRLEAIRLANLRLADPRGLSTDEARRLIAEGKTIVAVHHGIHSNEIASTQTAMETAYQLATTDDPALLQVLDQTVVVLVPSQNPDGTQRVTEWYRRTLNTPYEGTSPPFLYHKYVGHDDNRDWYMFTQAETRLTVRSVYDRWRPQIVHDLHQMGPRGARLFAPPYVDPYEPNVDPALRAAINALGTHVAARLTSEGKSGVVVEALYDAWGPGRAYPHTHGGVRILTEAASARLATPIEVRFEELESGMGYDAKEASWNFPRPWTGGTWRLRDIMDYQLSATRAILEHAALNRTFWLQTFYDVNRRAAQRSEPYAFVIPVEQKDPWATEQLVQVLRTGAIEIQTSRNAFEAGGRRFGAGTRVVLMAQPFSAFAKSLLETQHYPDVRLQPGAPPQRPYDVTAHTLPLLMGVDVVPVANAFRADLRPASGGPVPSSVPTRGPWLAWGHKTGDLIALGRLIRSGVVVRWSTQAALDHGRRVPAGTLFVPISARPRLEPLARELGLAVRSLRRAPPAMIVRRPRVGIYQSWVPTIDEGWTRFVFEKQVGVEYETLHDVDVRAGGLRARFDAIVLPDQSRAQIVGGNAPDSMPPEFTGGLGAAGVRGLRTFVEAGGTLVALNNATEMPVTEFDLPVRNVLAAVPPSEFYCPGAILGASVDPTNPLAHGLDNATSLWFEEGPAFEVRRGTPVMRYTDEAPLLSGWLLGGKRLLSTAALAEVPLGKGRVILFGFRPQYRGQSWATYVALLNALYTSAAVPSR